MKTEKVYYVDVYAKEYTSKVMEILPCPEDKNAILLVLDKTIFFPEGGGQSSDHGEINGLPVTHVSETADAIFHKINIGREVTESDLSSGLKDEKIIPGSDVHLSIDWARRFDNMQRHCGEHILSGICYRLFGGVNRGFHMGDDYMTIDISLEEKPEFKELTMDMCLDAEHEANKVIWDNLPVVRRIFGSREEASSMPLRKALAIDEDISIVTIGDVNDPADSVACCGTHPEHAGQVGMIKIYKVEPNKGMFRIFFEAGKRALLQYDKEYEILTTLGKDLSAGVPDLLDKYNAKNEKNKTVRDRLFNLTKKAIRIEDESIRESLNDSEPSIVRRDYELFTPDDIIELGRGLAGSIPSMLFLIHKPTSTIFLFSDKHDCGKIVKENAAVFGGKGGGNKTFARAIFQRADDLETFIQGVSMLLK